MRLAARYRILGLLPCAAVGCAVAAAHSGAEVGSGGKSDGVEAHSSGETGVVVAKDRIAFDGGPLIALPESLLGYWGGTCRNSQATEADATFRWREEVPTDYDRACSISTWAAVLALGPGHALVLDINDEPGPCTVWLARDYGGVFRSGDDLDCPEAVKEEAWQTLEDVVTLDSRLIVTTAATSGAEARGEDHLLVLLEPGTYRVAFAERHSDSGDLWTVFVRLERCSQ